MTRPAHRRPLSRMLPVIGGLVAGAAGAGFAAQVPADRLADLGRLAGTDRLPGPTVLLLTAGCASGLVVWAALYLIWGKGGPFDRPLGDAPIVRRADAHPDAPPRWPLTMAEIGTPPPREQELPTDLDQPLARFDPYAIPTMSFESIRRSGLRPSR
ncbi:hypothetical protein JAO74_07080 [Sphingomonas sp. BT553]|uniref:Uncharacterized protein n=2 Tax=Sphingomonas mollis TaxID=2795726 RepID=A0ABS0XND8_9SPHN|nr:hypothetical protein [Sphingomonas sp. BT553]